MPPSNVTFDLCHAHYLVEALVQSVEDPGGIVGTLWLESV